MPPSVEGRPFTGFQSAEQPGKPLPRGCQPAGCWSSALSGLGGLAYFRVLSVPDQVKGPMSPFGSPALFLLHQSEAQGKK